MCGIVGLVDRFDSNVLPEKIRTAANLLYRRGPDDSGCWVEGNVGLAHRRLAILDLSSAGHQPMVSPDGRYAIVFNGEIYNFCELRRLLAADGSVWRSQSDTEVILAAYAHWGSDCVKQFRGMFAFAIWDRKEQSLFAARDRMGVKPFYYHFSDKCFAFASRPRALLVLHSSITTEIDTQALRFYLESGYIPAPYSIHAQIRKLPPAHYMVIDGKGLKIERYWDFRQIPPEKSWEDRDEIELLDELEGVVSRAVKSRMISDVPLGAFLSGGIDSSLVVAMMAKHSSLPVKTFTIGFDDKHYDESGHALAVSQHLGTDHYCDHLGVDDLLQLMPTFSEEFDEPFFDSSAFPTMAVSRLARKHVTVSLSGDGGDELFGGYHYYQIAQRLGYLFNLPSALRRLMSISIRTLPQHQLQLLSGALQQNDVVSAFAFARSIAKDFHGVLLPELLGRTRSMRELFVETSRTFPTGLSPGEQGMRLDALYTLPDDYLQKVDVASMAYSLESREPLLDHELVEWAMKLPLKWKLRDGRNKYLLRKLTYRYIPQEILDRPKQGFGVPIEAWLRGPLKEWASERINDKGLFEIVPLDQTKVRELFELHCSGSRNVHPLLWAILMLLDFVAKQRSLSSNSPTSVMQRTK